MTALSIWCRPRRASATASYDPLGVVRESRVARPSPGAARRHPSGAYTRPADEPVARLATIRHDGPGSRPRHGQAAGLDDAGLLARDRLERVPEIRLVVEVDRRDRRRRPGRRRWWRRAGRRVRPRARRRPRRRRGTRRAPARSSLRRSWAAPADARPRPARVPSPRRPRSPTTGRAVDRQTVLRDRRGAATCSGRSGSPAARRPRSTIAVTEPLPLVPATTMRRERAIRAVRARSSSARI